MSATTDQRERELKFDVPDDWELPEPAELVPAGGGVDRDLVELRTVYFDTERLDLLEAGLVLRQRTGDDDLGWQLKVPDGDARTEVRHPLDGDDVPPPLCDLTAGVRAGARLQPVASLATERQVVRICRADRTALAEIAVDSVVAVRAGNEAAPVRWREVEVELLGGNEKDLTRAARWLGKHGARPAATASKLARALGPVTMPARPAGLGGLIADYLSAQRAAILRGDVDLRRGQDVVHRTRVGTRRYRSILRVFADLLDADRAAALDTELRWYAQALGRLRDRQVLRAHLDAQLAALPAELVLGRVAAPIHQALDAQLATARAELGEVLVGDRYAALLRELAAWQQELPVRAERPAADAGAYLRAAKRTVRKRLAAACALGDGEQRSEAMHRTRKAAKRARYTAELAEPHLGKRAATTVARMRDLQDLLGARQDGVVAAEFLRGLGAAAAASRGKNAFTFGLLFEQERERTRAADRAVC